MALDEILIKRITVQTKVVENYPRMVLFIMVPELRSRFTGLSSSTFVFFFCRLL